MIAAEDLTTVSDGAGTIQFIDVATGTPYPLQPELIGEPVAVAESQAPAIDPYTRDVMADLRAEWRRKDSTPVTFSALLAHHRRLAESSRADRAWHAEAVECLEVAIPRSAGCECGDDEACRFVRERDEARSEVERLRALLASSHEVRHADEAEVASLRSRVAELERWQGEAVPVLSFLLTLVPADVEVPESVWKLLERGEARAEIERIEAEEEA